MAGIRLADEQGLVAASMGGVAKELRVGTMTLYTYVPSKEELLDLMVDQVLAERDLPGAGAPRPDDWREQIEVYSEQTRAMFQRHPGSRRCRRSVRRSAPACWPAASTCCPRSSA